MPVSATFSLNQGSPIAVLNNTVATLEVTGLTLNSSSYYLLSFWEGTTKFAETYIPAVSNNCKVYVSPYLKAFVESKVLTNESILQIPFVSVKIKCTLYHTPIGSNITSYVATGTEDNVLFLALVPKLLINLSNSINFLTFYNNVLADRMLQYANEVKLLTKTEPYQFSLLAFRNGLSQVEFENFSNFRIKYVISFQDNTNETVYQSISTPAYLKILTIRADFPYVESIKTVAKVVTRFNVSVVAFGGAFDRQIGGIRNFRLDQKMYEYERTFCFLNSLSGWQYFSAHGNRKVVEKAKKESFSSFGDLVNASFVYQKQNINVENSSTAIIETGVDSRQNVAAFQEIIKSPLVYLVSIDDAGGLQHIPINILTEKIQSFDDENYLDSFTFEYEFNFTETSTQDFLN